MPGGVPAADIISELSESLQTKLEERQASLGRPLTEPEQADVLARHGNPLTVAAGYGPTNRGVAFGVQLISPEVFPPYVIALLLVFSVIVITHTVATLLGVISVIVALRTVLFGMLIGFRVDDSSSSSASTRSDGESASVNASSHNSCSSQRT